MIDTANSNRIVKNTALLYFRMLFMMAIVFYTSRVVLNALGIQDYGIYNTVGGVVALFSAISTTLSVAINRFLTYELGIGNIETVKKVFSTSINIQIGVIILFLLVAETIGLWYVNEKMVIPAERLNAANWCFQFSIFSFAINLISVPYNAAIVAHERMSAFAYFSIIDAIGKLMIAWGIRACIFDKLVVYALCIMLLAFLVRTLYATYCKHFFEECSYCFVFDTTLIRQMFGFVGWAFVGIASWALKSYGIVLLINYFFGPMVNAAYAIAIQVETAVTGFVSNFMMALNPQIVKAYAAKDIDYMLKLVNKGAKYSSYILLVLAIPVILNTHYVLLLWLKQVPDHTVLFVQLILTAAVLNSIGGSLAQAQIATGDIKKYQLVVSPIGLLTVPVIYLFFRLGYSPETSVVVSIILSQFSLVASLIMLRKMIGLNVRSFVWDVYIKLYIVAGVAFAIPFLLTYKREEPESFLWFLLLTLVSFCCSAFTILYLGCNKSEREQLSWKIRVVVCRIKEYMNRI